MPENVQKWPCGLVVLKY